MNVTSPDINSLDFSILYDISGATPHITLTNLSTGPNLAGCTWWYDIITPSGTYIHQGSQTSPDKTGVWAPFVVPDTWPQPFGQIEWSGNDYIATLYVKDSVGNVFSVSYNAGICRPEGSTSKTVGNFGVGALQVNTRCETAQLFVDDTTNYTYKGIFGTSVSKTITLVYPPLEDGTIPAPVTLTGFNSGLFQIQYNGEGYVVMMSAVHSYALSANVTVKIGYKTRDTFAVRCNIDLCVLMCEIDKLLADTVAECGQNIPADTNSKLLRINSLFLKAIAAKQQPLCGVDVAAIVDEIISIGGFTCNCLSGGTGINGSITGDINVTINGTCGDITGQATVVGSNITIDLQDKSYVFDIGNDTSNAFTVTNATDSPTCKKTYSLHVDLDILKADLGINACCNICVNVYEHGITDPTPPTACPDSYFPAYIYDYTNANVIGYANNATDLVAILNGDSTWNVKGTAINSGNCMVCFVPETGITAIDPVYVAPDNGGNPPSPSNYVVQVKDYCTPTQLVPQNAFPVPIYVAYVTSGQRYYVGLATNYADMITKLTAETHKPVNITYASISNTNPLIMGVNILDSNVPAANHVEIYADKNNLLLVGSNSHFGTPTAGTDGLDVFYPDTMSKLGVVCTTTYAGGLHQNSFHTIMVGNFMLEMESLGILRGIDMTNPLTPVYAFSQALYGLVSGAANVPFSGSPAYPSGARSDWDVYFPTDINAQTQGTVTYIVESTSGTIYKYDSSTNTVLGAFYSINLLGMCPRVIYNNKLYLTRDGSRQSLAGAGALNPIDPDSLVIVDLSIFSASAISSVQVNPGDDLWAMSIDPAQVGIAYITCTNGNIHRYDMINDVGTNTYLTVTPSLTTAQFINTFISNGLIYISAYGLGTWYCLLNALGPGIATAFDTLTTTTGTNVNHFNYRFIPGGCYGVLTYDNGAGDGGIAKYSSNGHFLGLIAVPGSMYNVLPFTGITSPTPNTLCP